MILAATLFSGIGAPEVAMPHWHWMWHAEIEAFPSAVMDERHPQSFNLGDVNAEEFIEKAIQVGRPDVIVFGSPCQDFSVAGQRVGLDGDRGNLALVALGHVAKLKPRWVVFENVPGLLSSYSGSAAAEGALRDRAERGQGIGETIDAEEDSDLAAFFSLVQQCGYLGFYRITDAQFAGVPQRRRRIFAVFHLGDWRPAAAVLLEPASLRGDHPPCREAGERFAPTIEARANAGGAGWGTDFMSGGGLAASTEIAGTVSSKWSKGTGGPAGDECQNLVAFDCKAGGNTSFSVGDIPGSLRGEGHGGGHSAIAFTSKDYGGVATIEQSPTLRAMPHDESHANGGGQIAIAFQPRIGRNGRGYEEEMVPALNGADAGATSDMRPCVVVEHAVRRLTPRECERLQAFPDDYTLIRYRGKPAADGPRYKALGNSMCVEEIRWVLSRIDRFEMDVRPRLTTSSDSRIRRKAHGQM